VTGIVAPVSLCMAITVALVRLLNPDGSGSSSSAVIIASLAYSEDVRMGLRMRIVRILRHMSRPVAALDICAGAALQIRGTWLGEVLVARGSQEAAAHIRACPSPASISAVLPRDLHLHGFRCV
jgi:hypothetical protein